MVLRMCLVTVDSLGETYSFMPKKHSTCVIKSIIVTSQQRYELFHLIRSKSIKQNIRAGATTALTHSFTGDNSSVKGLKRSYNTHSDNSRLVDAKEALKLADLQRDLDQTLQTLSSALAELICWRIRGQIPLNVHAHSSSLATGTTQPENNTRSIAKGNHLTLIPRNGMVDGILVLEVVQTRDGELVGGRRREMDSVIQGARIQGVVQVGDESVGTLRRNLFVVISTEEGSPVDGIELIEEIIDTNELARGVCIGGGQNVEPGYCKSLSETSTFNRFIRILTDNSPQAILLANVVRSGTERFFTTDRKPSSIHEITEEFPAYHPNHQSSVHVRYECLTGWDFEVL